MRNKNNPQSLVHTNLPSFPRSVFDRGAKVKYSLGIGGFFPIKHWDISANSHVKLNFHTKLDSFPSISPLYGILNLRFDVFYCPYRLYVPELFNNNITQIDDIDNIAFPMLHYIDPDGFANHAVSMRYHLEDESVSDVPIKEVTSDQQAGTFVPYGSALSYLGYPQMSLIRGKFGDDNGVNQDPNTDWMLSRYVSAVFNVTEANSYTNYFGPNDTYNMFIPHPYLTGSQTPWTFNLIPWLAYIDTYCHYIANPFDEHIPIKNMYYDDVEFFWTNSVSNDQGNQYEFINLKDLQKIVPIFRETAGAQTMVDASDFYRISEGQKYMLVTDKLFGKWWPFGMGFASSALENENYELWGSNGYGSQRLLSWGQYFIDQGILPSTYKPDYFTTWIDGDDYERAKVFIPTNQGLVLNNISVDLLRRKQREWAFNMRQLMSSKRYTDYNYMQYGAELNLRDYPIYVGGDTIKFSFQDILSQANNGSANSGDNLTNRVGGTAGKAYFDTRYFGDKMKRIDFTARENGLLLVCARLVPEVDYGRGVEKFLLKSFMSDLYKPVYDAVGFQDIQAIEIDAGVSNPEESIGKVPAFYEYMSSYNQVKGLFQTDGFRSWTFQRLYTRSGEYTEGAFGNDGENYGYYKPVALPTTYIMSEQFGYNFAYNGDSGHNFGLVTDFNLKVHQPQSKQLLNTRW